MDHLNEDTQGCRHCVDNSQTMLEQGGTCPSPPGTLTVPPSGPKTLSGVGDVPPAPKVNKPLLRTYQDIANFFGVSRMTLFRWLKLKPFPKSWVSTYYCHDNHRLRVDVERVMNWLRALLSKHPTSKARYVWKSIIKTRSVT